MGKKLGFKNDDLNQLKAISNLHDIGKIAIDDSILNKPGKLTEDEWEIIKRHPEIGYRIISTSPEYAEIANDILSHHEKYDGTGYIDILVESFEMKRIEAVLSDRGFKVEQKSPAHDAYSYEGLEVEIHPTLMNDFNPKYEFFKDAFNHAIQKELFEYVFEPNFETLYLMYHLAKHFEFSGVGLRSILDIGLYVKAYARILDKSTLESYLTSMSMTRFYNVMLELNKRYFGIESDLQIGAFTFTEEEYTNVSNYIMTSGIHGSGHSFNQMAPRLVNTQNKKQSKWFVLVKVLFPSYKNMRIMYPKLKTRLLLPVFYLIRFFNLTIKRGKDSRMKLRQLEDSSKNKEAVKQVFKTLGL